ncbi:oligosaccharide flippase family protein [Acinetobacter indicus]|uniref:oligosaccharide flippase family protein n=1 Tax=Acinetobacter indicus TaxID=756892 RepID=UPI001443F6F4|nr:oligosaccharide flippase family protein [Acinetobacter indicus]
MNKILQYAIGPVGVGILSLAVVPILAWSYDEKAIAGYAIIQALMAFSTLILTFGVDQSFVREYFDSENKPQLFKNTAIVIFMPMVLVLLLLNIIFYKKISFILFGVESQLITILIMISFFLVVLNRLLSLIQRMENQALLFSLSQILPKFFFLIIILLPSFGLFSPSFQILMFAYFFSILMVNIYFILVNKSLILRSFKEELSQKIIINLLRYGFPLLISNFLFWGLRYLDRFYVKIFSSDYELALYTIAISLAGGVAIFGSIFNTIWTPKAFLLHKNGKLNSHIINKMVVAVSLIGLLFVSIIFVLSPVLSLFFPQKYISIIYLLPLLVLPTLFYTVAEVSGIGISITKNTTKMIYVSCISLILHFILSILLIVKLGALGAAISIAVAFYFYLLLKTLFSAKVWSKSFSKLGLGINLICLMYSLAIGFRWI